MKGKLLPVSILLTLVPYLALFAIATVLLSAKVTFFGSVMESVFGNNGFYLIAALLVCYLVIFTFDIIYFVVSVCKKWDALALAKAAMIIKIVQIPAYIMIFVLGVLFFISIITIPFSIGLFLVDCLSVFMSGLLVVSSAINAVRNKKIEFKKVIWVIILQFVFCADVVASIIYYIKLKRISKQEQNSI